jgi:hypothetical protein
MSLDELLKDLDKIEDSGTILLLKEIYNKHDKGLINSIKNGFKPFHTQKAKDLVGKFSDSKSKADIAMIALRQYRIEYPVYDKDEVFKFLESYSDQNSEVISILRNLSLGKEETRELLSQENVKRMFRESGPETVNLIGEIISSYYLENNQKVILDQFMDIFEKIDYETKEKFSKIIDLNQFNYEEEVSNLTKLFKNYVGKDYFIELTGFNYNIFELLHYDYFWKKQVLESDKNIQQDKYPQQVTEMLSEKKFKESIDHYHKIGILDLILKNYNEKSIKENGIMFYKNKFEIQKFNDLVNRFTQENVMGMLEKYALESGLIIPIINKIDEEDINNFCNLLEAYVNKKSALKVINYCSDYYDSNLNNVFLEPKNVELFEKYVGYNLEGMIDLLSSLEGPKLTRTRNYLNGAELDMNVAEALNKANNYNKLTEVIHLLEKSPKPKELTKIISGFESNVSGEEAMNSLIGYFS